MSFLTPLYLLGALAVTLPVVFHMIRRRPRGRQEFSSVMFLEPSPPRVTRRSRIEHWFLLVLRGLAVCVLATAFARPFYRVSQEQTLEEAAVRDIVLLVDTSASMRREGLWAEAVSRVEGFLRQVRPTDRVSLVSFDTEPRVSVEFSQWTALDPIQRVEAARRALSALAPTWKGTDLGRALVDVAETLDAEASRGERLRTRMIVLVSDLQQGCRLQALQAYEWPQQVLVRLEIVGTDASPNNAGLQPFLSADPEVEGGGDSGVRVRIANAADSRREQFTLRWSDDVAATDGGAIPEIDSPRNRRELDGATTVTVIVPPGQSRVVKAPPRHPASGAFRLRLDGDDHEFDNTCYVAEVPRQTATVEIVSRAAADDSQGLWYYLERALASTPRRLVEVHPMGDLVAANSAAPLPDLIVVAAMPSPEQMGRLRTFLDEGGTVLLVPPAPEDVRVLHELAGVASEAITEASLPNYAMLTDIDWSHPLFAALDHPRFSDFSKVRFWKHRVIDPEALPDVHVIARFDNGHAAIGETRVGNGRIVFFTSGWHPDDSQLAVSTKFVPMLNGLLDSASGLIDRPVQFAVGDAVDFRRFATAGNRVSGVQTAEGHTFAVAVDDESEPFRMTDVPGRYRVLLGDGPNDPSAEFAVNLDPAESQTARLPRQALEAVRVNLAQARDSGTASADGVRQLRASELEQKQKLWRWLIVFAILLLLVETWLASRALRWQTDKASTG